MMIAVMVSENSNMLAHGTRPAATPRRTVPLTCSTQPMMVRTMATRTERDRRSDAPAGASVRSRTAVVPRPAAAAICTAGVAEAIFASAARRARSSAKKMNASAYTAMAE